MAVLALSTPTSPVQGLQTLLDALRHEDVQALPSSAQAEDLTGLHRVMSGLTAEFTRRVGIFDRSQGFAPAGYLSAASWLHHNCRLTSSAAHEQVRLARRL